VPQMFPSPLIDHATLATRIADPKLRVFDCRFSLADTGAGRRAYDEGHLPGARYAHLDEHLSGPITPSTGRHPLPDPERLAAWLGACGVGDETDVVVYDDDGGAFAGRLWWLLRWLGHDRVALLDGGLQAWQAMGGEMTKTIPTPTPVELTIRRNDDAWVSTERLVSALPSGELQVIDARGAERFRGEEEPVDPVAGHIPGALNLPMTGNLDADGRFLPADVLRRRFLDALGGRASAQVAHSCGSGVSACHNLLAMELAGLVESRLYVGSWSEWIRDPARAVATGN
jgi:thiosulfate/3-mercaptopyruvate sulfurtransferase